MNNLIDLCTEWANKRNIIEGSTIEKQMEKLDEEFVELDLAVRDNNDFEIKDALGDMMVVMNNIAQMQGTALQDCLQQAYDEIKDRVGVMKDGIYVKGILAWAVWDCKDDTPLTTVGSYDSALSTLASGIAIRYPEASVVQVICLDDGEVRRWD